MNEFVFYRLIGSRVKIARQEKGWSQDILAFHLGLTRTSLTNIENGRQRTPVHILFQIAELLGVSLHQIIPNEQDMEKTAFVEINGQSVPVTPELAQLLSEATGKTFDAPQGGEAA